MRSWSNVGFSHSSLNLHRCVSDERPGHPHDAPGRSAWGRPVAWTVRAAPLCALRSYFRDIHVPDWTVHLVVVASFKHRHGETHEKNGLVQLGVLGHAAGGRRIQEMKETVVAQAPGR